MANYNTILDMIPAQCQFRLELSDFLNYIKTTYPNEENRVSKLCEHLFSKNARKALTLDTLDNLSEKLAKAKALTVVALGNNGLCELDAATISNYFWTLEDLLNSAEEAIAQNS